MTFSLSMSLNVDMLASGMKLMVLGKSNRPLVVAVKNDRMKSVNCRVIMTDQG